MAKSASNQLKDSAPESVNQDEALLKYKVTGHVGDYVDPTRDQEVDLAPEFGDAPHPELANPEPAGVPPLGAKVPGNLAFVAAFDPDTQEVKGAALDIAQVPVKQQVSDKEKSDQAAQDKQNTQNDKS